MQKILFNCSLLLLCGLFATCEIINPEEDLPAYLQINEFTFTTTGGQGTNVAQITDAWVYSGDISLGIYELPATVPVLNLGDQTITIFPVIRENGLRSAPVLYPFYQRYTLDVNLTADQTITVQPTTAYLANSTVFDLVEDFEGTSHKLTGRSPDAVKINKMPDKVVYGNGVGQILLDTLSDIIFISSPTFGDLPTQGNLSVYLEISYKTNAEFNVGLVGLDNNPSNPINAIAFKVTLCPIDRWNKVYINFQKDLTISQLPNYKLAFRLSTDDTGCGQIENETPELLIDNIKLIRQTN